MEIPLTQRILRFPFEDIPKGLLGRDISREGGGGGGAAYFLSGKFGGGRVVWAFGRGARSVSLVGRSAVRGAFGEGGSIFGEEVLGPMSGVS